MRCAVGDPAETSLRQVRHPGGVRWRSRSPIDRLVPRVTELARFSFVGTVAFFVDLGVFNLLRFGPWEAFHGQPLTAKVVSVVLATFVSWLGSTYWTFAHRGTGRRGREVAGFIVVNLGAMLISLACLGVSHYVLGLRSPLADNISANVIGLILATAFRYLAYRRFVYTGGVPGIASGMAR